MICRVLKPPGGGSSDIFGQGAGPAVENSPRRVRTYVNSSQLFSDNAASSSSNTTSSSNGSNLNSNGTTASNKPGNDSHERLFGPLLNRPPSAVKDRLKSNILIGVDAANDNQNNMVNGNHQNGNNDHTGEGSNAPREKLLDISTSTLNLQSILSLYPHRFTQSRWCIRNYTHRSLETLK